MLLAGAMGAFPSMSDWALAHLVGDAAYEQAATPVFDRPSRRAYYRIRATLHSHLKGAVGAFELFDKRGQ